MVLAGKRTLKIWGLTALCALAPTVPAVAQEIRPAGASEVLLRNGQWTWLESPAFQPAGGADSISMVISIPAQMAYIYRDSTLIAASTISTGKRGKGTPTGEFTILQKRVHHRSNIYSNAPMPFMQRLTWDGIALHAGTLPGYPASHGCIRFPREFAKRLFAITQLGTPVSVVDQEIEDPRVRHGVEPVVPEQIARRPDPPQLRADPAAFRTGEFDVVTASNDVLIPGMSDAAVQSDSGVVFAQPKPVVQGAPRRRR